MFAAALARKILVVALLASGLAWLLAGSPSAAGARAVANFRRGIGITTMAWAEVEPGPSRAFVFPPFSDRVLTLGELQTLRSIGFDFVRFAVDPGPFLQFSGSRRDALDRMLMDRVKLILAAGLSVVVDFHPSDLHPEYTAESLTTGLDASIFKAYLRLLQRTAGLLDALHSDRVALELLNEPPFQPIAWQPMLNTAYAAAREGSSHLILVLEGGDKAADDGLTAVRTGAFATDQALLFAFHYYDPYQFTHQGAPWNAARHLADVPYPALARPLQDSLDASAAVIAAADLSQAQKAAAYRDARDRLESYRRSGFDGRSIAGDFDKVAEWAKSQGIPRDRIMLGEFGARRTALQLYGARAQEHLQWFRDVRKQAESDRFGWAVWVYRGNGGFALAESDTSSEIERPIADALGLTFK